MNPANPEPPAPGPALAPPGRPPRRRRRGLLWALWAAWTLAGMALALVVGLDLALRLFFAAKDAIRPLPAADPRLVAEGYGGADWVGAYFRELDRIEAEWSPYVDFRVAPFDGRLIHVDPGGIRRTWSPPGIEAADAGVPEVLVLGGSSAWGLGARDGDTIPSLLAKELEAAGRRVRVTNLGQIGHVSTQGVLTLILELRAGRRPDIVVFYDGVNDVLAALQSGRAGGPQNAANRAAEFHILASPPRLLAGFLLAVARDSALSRLAGSAARRLGLAPRGGPAVDFGPDRAGAVLRAYDGNIRIVEALGQTYGFTPLFCWQPVVFTKRLTPYEREKAAQYAWLAEPFAAVNGQLARRVTPPRNGRFRDLTHLLDDSDDLLFVDFCHTTEAANRRIARAIAAEVGPLLAPRAAPGAAGGPTP